MVGARCCPLREGVSCGRRCRGLHAGFGPAAAHGRAQQGVWGKQHGLSLGGLVVLRACGAPPSPGRAASGRLGWRRPQNSIPAALQGPGPRPHNDSGPRPSAIELGRGDGAHSASPHSPGRQVDDGERPPQPRLGLRSLSHAALPGLTAGYGNSGAPASVFC